MRIDGDPARSAGWVGARRGLRPLLFLPRIELRPELLDHGAVAGERVAAVEEGGALGGFSFLLFVLIATAFRPEGLIGHRRHGTQHLDVMGAAVNAAQALLQLAFPAGSDAHALDHGEIRRDAGTDVEGRRVGRDLDVMDQEMNVEGEPDAHVVERLAGFDPTPVVIGKTVSLAVGHPAFDVPKAVLAAEALELIAPVVEMLALDRGGGKGHGLDPCTFRPPSPCWARPAG